MVTAYLIVLFCCMHWGYLPSGKYDVTVTGIRENAPVSTVNSGIQSGDKIYSINGREVQYFHELLIVANWSKKYDGIITPEQQEKVMGEFLNLNKGLNADGVIQKGQTVNLPKHVEEEKIELTDTDVYGLKNNKKYIALNRAQQKIRNYSELDLPPSIIIPMASMATS